MMPDFTVETAWTCSSNEDWERQVTGSKGDVYTVTYGAFTVRGGGDTDIGFNCTCRGFKTHNHCKHVEQVRSQHCGWNKELEPSAERTPDGKCPNCGADVVAVRVAV